VIINKDASDTRFAFNKVSCFPRTSVSWSRLPTAIDGARRLAIRNGPKEAPCKSLFLWIVSKSRTTGCILVLIRDFFGSNLCKNSKFPRAIFAYFHDLSHYFLLETRDMKGDKAGESRIKRWKAQGKIRVRRRWLKKGSRGSPSWSSREIAGLKDERRRCFFETVLAGRFHRICVLYDLESSITKYDILYICRSNNGHRGRDGLSAEGYQGRAALLEGGGSRRWRGEGGGGWLGDTQVFSLLSLLLSLHLALGVV